MGIHDRDWYRDGHRGPHFWHDMPGGMKVIAILLGLGLLLHFANSWQGGGEYADYNDDAMIFDVFDAIDFNNVARAAELLNADPSQVNLDDGESGAQPLHYAAMHGSAEMIELLLSHNANVTATDDTGQTPLHYAATHGNAAAAKALLDAGAEIESRDSNDRTPLAAAAVGQGFQTHEVIDLLRRNGAQYDLPTAILLGDTAHVREQLQKDPHLLDEHPHMNQLLADAVSSIQTRVYRQWMQRIQDNPNFVAIAMNGFEPYEGEQANAIVREHVTIMELLIKHGADVNGAGADQLPLIAAASVPNPEVAACLIKHGAIVKARKGRLTPLKIALQSGNTEVVKLLKKHGASR